MRATRWVMLSVMVAATVTWAEPSTQPTRKMRLVQPWSKVTDLSDEQREQIVAIHAEITDKMNALREEERERCLAVLTEEQRLQLDATQAREAAERKARLSRKPATDAEKQGTEAGKADKN